MTTPDDLPDDVDRIIAQWQRERPDLDLAAMATLGRLGRLFGLLGRAVDATFAEHDLQRGEYDVLAALRRAGAPYALTPSALADTLMLSRAGMTNRLDRLETAGLIERQANRADRRSLRVALTPPGLALVDAVTTEHVANESRLLSALSAQERATLDDIARKLLHSLG
ncbi:MarR family winged helix-turn-helix transcriptional regulator [Dactylosporangium sp. CS-033363]|uniref:MarR family winged helix-turn-helix transcriptional regulator n=1 Tax=Dactylosporangium sp. CS-033363 TaxID=3239935 RepID=UPI003D8AE42C